MFAPPVPMWEEGPIGSCRGREGRPGSRGGQKGMWSREEDTMDSVLLSVQSDSQTLRRGRSQASLTLVV